MIIGSVDKTAETQEKGNLDERYGKWYFIHGTVLPFQKTEEERRN